MFDFFQFGEIYCFVGFFDVVVVGILEDGILWEMLYCCLDIVWNLYCCKFSIFVCIFVDGCIIDILLGCFLWEFICDCFDLFKCSFVNWYVVLKEMVGDLELQKWWEKYLDIYLQDIVLVSWVVLVVWEWWEIFCMEFDLEIILDNSYCNYL